MNLKRIISVFLISILTLGLCSIAYAVDDIPDGYTPIYTADDLKNIRNNLSGKYVLMNHINLSDYSEWTVIGNYGSPFAGELDGNGYSIIGLKSKRSLLGWVENAMIKNLGIVNCNIFQSEETASFNSSAGAIADNAIDSYFEKCFASGSVQACVSVGWLDTKSYCSAGGLVGVAQNSSFIDCYNSTNLNFIYDEITSAKIGGIAGDSLGSSFECCYSTGKIEIKHNGKNPSESENIFKGGLVGFADESTALVCCYYLNNISFAIGNLQTNPNGTKNLTNEEMKNQNSYIGFDFAEIWKVIPDNYPKLIIEKPFKTQNVSINYKEKIDVSRYVVGEISGFVSSNESIVVIDEDGCICGLAVGEASVTIFTKDNHIVVLNIDVSYNIWQKLIVYFLFGWLWY